MEIFKNLPNFLAASTLRYIEMNTRFHGPKNRVIFGYIHKQALPGYRYRYTISERNAKKEKFADLDLPS